MFRKQGRLQGFLFGRIFVGRGGGGGDVFDDVIGYRSDHARASGFARRGASVESETKYRVSHHH